MPTNTKNIKEEAHSLMLRHLGLPKKTRAVIVSFLDDVNLDTFLSLACGAIGVHYVVTDDPVVLTGVDIAVFGQVDPAGALFINLISHQVIPVAPVGTPELKEFNPMKFEGNAFLYEKCDQFQILEKIIRALENMRYPGDKRVLLKNIVELVSHEYTKTVS